MSEPTEFLGWSVESDEAGNQITLTKAHPAGIDGVLRVHTRGGSDTSHAMIRAIGAQQALAEDVRVSTEDDKTLWEQRHAQALEHVKSLQAEERRKREGDAAPTPADGIDAIIDAPPMTALGRTIAPEGAN